jgi:nitrate/nitrite transporter NarK
VRSFSQWFPARERGLANGVLFLGSRLGGAITAPIALLLIERWGWRLSFVVFGAFGIVWAIPWYRSYRDRPAEHPEVNPQELAWIQQDGVRTESNEPTPWRRLLTSPNLYAICAMYFTFGYGLYFYFTWLPTYLISELRFSLVAGGFFSSLPFLLAGAANITGGWCTDALARTRGLRTARVALGVTAFSTCALLILGAVAVSTPVGKALLLALALASADFALSACWSVCLDVAPHHAGVVTGFMNTFGNLGGLVGPIVVGVMVDRLGSWTLPLYVTAGVYFAGALAWLAIDPNRRIA